MFPRYYLLSTFVLLGATHGAVQNTTVTLFLDGFQKAVSASIVASDATTTAYSLGCGESGSDSCGIETFAQGPSTVIYGYTLTVSDGDGVSFFYKIGCAMSTDSANCLVTVTQAGPYQTTRITTVVETYNSFQYQRALRAVTITAGPGVVSSTPTLTASTASNSNTASLASTGSVTAAIGSLSSTGGAPMVTNGPLLFAGGAAAALAFGAM